METAPEMKSQQRGELITLLQDIQAAATNGVKITQRQIAEKVEINEEYLSQMIQRERRGENAPKKLVQRIRDSFQYHLTGKLLFRANEGELLGEMAKTIIEQKVMIERLSVMVCELYHPENPDYELKKLESYQKAEVERRLGELRL